MKYRNYSRFFYVIFAVFALNTVNAQTTSFNWKTEHFTIESSVSKQHAKSFGDQLETLFEFYNEYFHFDENEITELLQVRLFATRERYEAYLGTFLDNLPAENYIYLHYNNLLRNTLIGYQESELAATPVKSMIRQSFMQFLRTFVHNPPLWMRGFALYFENIEFNETFENVTVRDNLIWLEKLQEILNQNPEALPISIDSFLSMDTAAVSLQENSDSFYPMAWGFTSFLLNTNSSRYSRFLWDSISALKKNASMQENIDSINKAAFSWFDPGTFSSEYRKFIEEKNSFKSLIAKGKELYDAQEFDKAEELFIAAMEARPENYIPYYYRGLISYSQGKVGPARAFYESALERDIDIYLANYALGILEYSQSNFEEARKFFVIASEPESKYLQDAENLIQKIDALNE